MALTHRMFSAGGARKTLVFRPNYLLSRAFDLSNLMFFCRFHINAAIFFDGHVKLADLRNVHDTFSRPEAMKYGKELMKMYVYLADHFCRANTWCLIKILQLFCQAASICLVWHLKKSR